METNFHGGCSEFLLNTTEFLARLSEYDATRGSRNARIIRKSLNGKNLEFGEKRKMEEKRKRRVILVWTSLKASHVVTSGYE